MADSMRERLDAEAEADREAMEAQQAPDEPAPVPDPAPAPAPEQPAEPAAATTEPAEPAKPRGDGMVPLAALHEERTRRQELERQQREMQQQMAELRGRFEGMLQPKAAAPEPEKPDPEPKYDDNPAEWFRWRDRQQTKEIAALKKAAESYESDRKQRQQQEQAAQQQQQFLGHYANAAQAFARETPDFGEAYQHLVKSRVEELIQAGYTPQQASYYQQQEEANVAAHALSQGANPAERLYAIAKMRGYAKAEGPAPAVPPAVPPATAPNPLRAQLSKSLSAAPGAPSNPPTLEQIANMSDAEYGRVVDSPEAFRRLMGG